VSSPSRLALLEHLADLIAARQQPHPIRVAIDGVDAAGKTTLADELAALLAARGRPVIRACIDGFGRSRADRYRRGELSAEGYWLDAFDYPALRADLLEPLGPGGTCRYRTATFDVRTNQPRAEPFLLAPPDAVLVLDGVFLLRPELNDAWDLRSSWRSASRRRSGALCNVIVRCSARPRPPESATSVATSPASVATWPPSDHIAPPTS
jgi:uridine kinase